MKDQFDLNTKTFQIHLTGIVQGVGFRPFVYNLALREKRKGWVSNTASGVYIRFNATMEEARSFFQRIIQQAPAKAKIISQSLNEVEAENFSTFEISKSLKGQDQERSITPDFATCTHCKTELENPSDRRYAYPFITCSECGPRYSIIDTLPYDRENTRMQEFTMCPECQKEYESTDDRRFFSQSNSCKTCGVKLSLYSYVKEFNELSSDEIIKHAAEALKEGGVICLKGIGGYMLLADARNQKAIMELRKRKNRPDKPFAVMVKDLAMAEKIAHLSPFEKELFLSDSAPILLLAKKNKKEIACDLIAPQLNEIGLLRPYTPLHQLLMNELDFPLIATSGNISGSPIIFKDEEIIEGMRGIADLILTHNRAINAAQDDSVIRCTKDDEAIIIRRSRGLAPNVLGIKAASDKSILAMGAMLKSTVGMAYKGNIFISQYIGNSNSYETQLSYSNTYDQLRKSVAFKAEIVLSDKHPGYFTHELATEIAAANQIEKFEIQHHEAHFCSVLGEFELWENEVLGVIWDGTGLGNDGNIWGGELFKYAKGEIKRVDHLPYQKHLLGDKMVQEARIAAFSFFNHIPAAIPLLKTKFTDQEWKTYSNLYDKSKLLTSSIGRLFDAVAAMLGLNDKASFHGQAAMLLEAKALENNNNDELAAYPQVINAQGFQLHVLLECIVSDLIKNVPSSEIALRFHHSLVTYIEYQTKTHASNIIAFSGGVFQNRLLVELTREKLNPAYTLYFNQQFSPNDESISFGQLMHYLHIRSNTPAL